MDAFFKLFYFSYTKGTNYTMVNEVQIKDQVFKYLFL